MSNVRTFAQFVSNPYFPPAAPVADALPVRENKDGHSSAPLLIAAGLALLFGVLSICLVGTSLFTTNSFKDKDEMLLLLALSAFSVGCLASACGLYVRQFWGTLLWLLVTLIPSLMSIADPSRRAGDARYLAYTLWFLLATAIAVLLVEARRREARRAEAAEF